MNAASMSAVPSSAAPEVSPGSLAGRVRQVIREEGSHQELRRARVVLEEGAPVPQLFLVESGLLKVVKQDRMERNIILRIAGEGELLGLEGLTGRPASAHIQTITPCVVSAVPVQRLRELMADDTGLAMGLMDFALLQETELELKLRDFGLKDARSRAAAVLLHHAGPSNTGNKHVVRHLTRQDLAAAAGMTPETFIRILSALKEKGIVKTEGRLITILAPERLASMSGQHPNGKPVRQKAEAGNGARPGLVFAGVSHAG